MDTEKSVDGFSASEPYDIEIVRKHYRFFAIDQSEVGGSFSIKYDGYSQASQAAIDALKAKQTEDWNAAWSDWTDALRVRDKAWGVWNSALIAFNEVLAVRDAIASLLRYLRKALADTPGIDVIRRGNLNGEIAKYEEKLEKAEDKLDTAKGNLDTAKGNLDTATTNADTATTNADTAKDKLDKISTGATPDQLAKLLAGAHRLGT